MGGGIAAAHFSYYEDIVIALTRLNGHPVMVNSDLIEQLEETPDTVVTLTSGNRLVVRDKMTEIQQKIIDFKRRIYAP
jgi:flagellar protein FlbD